MTRHPHGPDDIRRLYDRHGRMLLAYACAILRDVASAEDVVHGVFTRLLRGGLAIDGDPAPYLCRAVRNAAFNQRRGRDREVPLEPEARWLEAPPGLDEMALAIQDAVAALPAEQREVVVLHVWGGMTFREVGRALDIPANTAASRYRYGLAKLRDLLEPRRQGPNDSAHDDVVPQPAATTARDRNDEC